MLSQSSTVGGVRHLMYDGHGSTRLLTDSAGAVSDRYDYDAYGVAVGFIVNSPISSSTNRLYAGEQFDAGLQIYNLRARYYDQSNGRFRPLRDFSGSLSQPEGRAFDARRPLMINQIEWS